MSKEAEFLYDIAVSREVYPEEPDGESLAILGMLAEIRELGYPYEHFADIELRTIKDAEIMKILLKYYPQMESLFTKEAVLRKIDPKKFPVPFEESMYNSMPMALVNPEITAVSGDVAERDEGCLSVPEIYAPVVRPARVAFRAQLLSGTPVEGECGGLLGRCLQHEIDHLDGYLFTDRLSPEAARRIEGQFKRLVEFGKSHDFRRVTRK